jgi:hypothetical protein
MTPNWFATVALLAWPIVALWLYHRRPVGQATLWTILGAQLFLPAGIFIKLAQGIPQLDRISIPSLAALMGCILYARRPLRFWNGFGLPEVLLLMSITSPFITSELNGDLVRSGILTLPSVGHYDALSAVISELLFLLPFFLSRQVLKSAADNAEIFRTLAIAGLIYSVPMLFELRMSPQLNLWVYGYYSSDFIQEVRDGGFRPMVFMGHGLAVAFFTMTTVIATATLWRIQSRVLRIPASGIAAYLSVLLILCKSLGALVYGVILTPLVRWTSPRLQVRVALVLVSIAMAYPLLRAANLIPTTTIVDLAKSVSTDRAASLETRFDQEQQLLDRASERLLFGWGRFGRSRLYDMYGRDITRSDGRWIITLGQFGLFGFLAEFGLLALPVFLAASALRYTESRIDSILLAALTIVLAVNILDLVPNASISPWTWLIAGALLGRTEALRRAAVRKRITHKLTLQPSPLAERSAERP